MGYEKKQLEYPHIFSELKVRGKVIRNRTFSGPMILEWGLDKNGFITERGMKAFGAMAKGGTGVITLGEAKIDDLNSRAHAHHFESRDPDVIQNYHFFTEYVHAYGSLASIEFNHNGQHALPEFNPRHLGPMGPSEMTMASGIHVREMTKEDMDTVAESYAQAALIARRGGFDMILLHFAHGWLMGGFLSPQVNKRTDEYGGSLENRMRFPLQVIHRIREVAGEDLIIEIRLNGSDYSEGGIVIEDAIEQVKQFEADGNVDLIHMSCGTRMDGRTRAVSMSSHFIEQGHNLKFAEAVKKAGVKIPIGVVGGIADPEFVEEAIASGKADYVVMARQLIADPDWANKAKHGHAADIRRCMRCQHCMDTNRVNSAKNRAAVMEDWTGTKIHLCDINPTFGHAALIGEIPAPKKKKKVVVIGGGPAGIVAAVKADELGHQVILYEQSSKFGGLLKVYADPVWFKQGEAKYLRYLEHKIEKSTVEVHLKTKATPELVASQNPDTVIVAIGGKADHRKIEVENGSSTIDVIGIYNHEHLLGKKTIIIGGNTSGCEAALHLAHLGIESIVLEQGDMLLPKEGMSYRLHTLQYMEESDKIEYFENRKVVKIIPGGVETENVETSEREIYRADTVIYATGLTEKEEEASEFEDIAYDVIKIGDCKKIGTIGTAVHQGYNAAVTIYEED